jgi:hypothetical protein
MQLKIRMMKMAEVFAGVTLIAAVLLITVEIMDKFVDEKEK